MADDDDLDLDDEDDDDGDDLGEGEGHAAVMCTTETLGARFTFVDSVEEAQLLAAQPCQTPGCLGHTIAYGDGTGRVRIIVDDGHDFMDRRRDVLRARERRRMLRKRLYDAERQQQRRDAKRQALEREDTDVDPG